MKKKTEKRNIENKNGNKWRKTNEWEQEEKWKYKEKERDKVKRELREWIKKDKESMWKKICKNKAEYEKGVIKVEEKWKEEEQKAEKRDWEFKKPPPPPQKINRKNMQNIYVANARYSRCTHCFC